MRFDVFIAVTIDIQVFWATFNQCIVIQATCSFEMLVPLARLQCHNPENRSGYDRQIFAFRTYILIASGFNPDELDYLVISHRIHIYMFMAFTLLINVFVMS